MEKQKSEHFLSLIIPVYKQEKTIVSNIKRIKKILDNIRYDYEIIVVVDGILDNSLENIKRAKIDKVKTIGYEKNQGKGWAVRLGLLEASGDYAMFIDAGEEIDPNGISMLIAHMEWYDADIIVGSKRHPASQVIYPASRKILSYTYYYLVKILFGIKVRDTQAGIKIFKKKVLEKVLPRLVAKKFTGDLEMLVVAETLGFKRIYEAPVRLNYNLGSLSQAATWKSIIGILFDTFAIFYRKNFLRVYKK